MNNLPGDRIENWSMTDTEARLMIEQNDELKAENTRLQGQIDTASDLLFGTDEPLVNPVDLDGLNGLFRNLRKALGV